MYINTINQVNNIKVTHRKNLIVTKMSFRFHCVFTQTNFYSISFPVQTRENRLDCRIFPNDLRLTSLFVMRVATDTVDKNVRSRPLFYLLFIHQFYALRRSDDYSDINLKIHLKISTFTMRKFYFLFFHFQFKFI